MAGSLPDDAEDPRSSIVSITVLSIKPVKLGRIFALASVEIDINGLVLVLHRVCALRLQPIGTLINLPMFRDENGVWRHAVTLPDEISGPIGKAVLDELVARGLAVRSPVSEDQAATRSALRPYKGPADVITSKMAAPLGRSSLAINPIITWRMRAFTRQARRL